MATSAPATKIWLADATPRGYPVHRSNWIVFCALRDGLAKLHVPILQRHIFPSAVAGSVPTLFHGSRDDAQCNSLTYILERQLE